MKAPFWYVVKARGDNWSPPFDGWHYRVVGPGYIGGDWTQRRATVFTDIRVAKRRRDQCREEGGEAKVVRIWARLPEPKLPQWVDPTPLDAGEVEAWRRGETCWQRYVVRVGLVVSIRRAEDHMPEGVTHYTNVDAAPADVWVEAGLRAASMLRKANR